MGSQDRVAREVVVRGRVQGVCYRDSCRRYATSAGVAGWIRNEADGSVRAVVEGPEDAVERVLRWMHSGPRGAVVAGVEVVTMEPRGLSGFQIR